jgi:hypothetical protein
VKGEHGETAMHIAAANGYVEVIEYLLDHGAKIDVVDNDFWQPIHPAACWGQDKIIEILANHGSDLDAETADGETPSDLTEDEELQGMIQELKESGKQTRELRRTQSNSSRTLSVRRSSIMDKHRISVNDAKQEGIFRQNPEFLKVVISTDEVEETHPIVEKIDITSKHATPLKDNFENDTYQSSEILEEEAKQTTIDIGKYICNDGCKESRTITSNQRILVSCDTNHQTINDIKPGEVNVDIERCDTKENCSVEVYNINRSSHDDTSLETDLLVLKGTSPDAEIETCELKDIKVNTNITSETTSGIDDRCNSYNTAVKKKNKTLSESTEITVKKKCCIIV